MDPEHINQGAAVHETAGHETAVHDADASGDLDAQVSELEAAVAAIEAELHAVETD